MGNKWNENIVKCSDCGIEWKKIGKSCPVCYAPPEKIIPTHKETKNEVQQGIQRPQVQGGEIQEVEYKEIKNMKKCIICGELIEDNLWYCPHCGEWNSCSGLTLKDIFEAESGGPIIE